MNELFVFLQGFSQPIRDYYDFLDFKITGLSPISLYKEEKNYRIGQVELLLNFEFNWELTLEQPLIKGTKIVES
jgi:hypothetical protein